ncbi:hypothetical protein MML48_2g00007285 [Holotrichia oblita]|uniref:Uncharacterized protein n=1 Tax=Holotrichia oblita TaxID=644536 RepID=A0ACB9TPE1_HOLOL|nr:hypothetical protein MML48_2g00007285 [Holotrichia oblita]
MQNRMLRERLPIRAQHLKPEIAKRIQTRKKVEREKAKRYYGRTAKTLKPFEGNEIVSVRKESEWIPGRIIENHNALRSYLVQTDDNILRRNRKDLRPSLNPIPTRIPYQVEDTNPRTEHNYNISII